MVPVSMKHQFQWDQCWAGRIVIGISSVHLAFSDVTIYLVIVIYWINYAHWYELRLAERFWITGCIKNPDPGSHYAVFKSNDGLYLSNVSRSLPVLYHIALIRVPETPALTRSGEISTFGIIFPLECRDFIMYSSSYKCFLLVMPSPPIYQRRDHGDCKWQQHLQHFVTSVTGTSGNSVSSEFIFIFADL